MQRQLIGTCVFSPIPPISRTPQPDAHWLWGNEQEAWTLTDGSFYTKTSNELGTAFAMKAALFVSVPHLGEEQRQYSPIPFLSIPTS